MFQLTRPLGRGFYVRDWMTPADGISARNIALLKSVGIRFAAVNVVHPISIARLDRAGIHAWVFGGVDQWGPSRWRDTLAKSHQVALQTRCHRIWADPENGWPDAGPAEWAALGSELARIARSGIQVACTTHGGLRGRVATHVAPRIAPYGGVISPQLYDHSRGASLDYADASDDVWNRTMSGCQIVPSIGCLGSGPDGPGEYTDARFAAVFARYPRSWKAAIVWPDRSINAAQARTLAAWKVGYAPEIG